MSPAELFARGVWKQIPDEEDVSWVNRVANLPGDDGPCGDYGPIMKEMLEKGIAPETIARFAKLVGFDVAGNVCYHMEDPHASYEGFPDEDEKISWLLFQIDPEENDKVVTYISGVHTYLVSMDPSDREMRPKK